MLLCHCRVQHSFLPSQKYTIPENWMYKEARALFIDPDVAKGEEVEVIILSQ